MMSNNTQLNEAQCFSSLCEENSPSHALAQRARLSKEPLSLAPFLIISAASDLGLEKDSIDFVLQLKRLLQGVESDVIPHTSHPSICWSPKTSKLAAEWITTSCLTTTAE